MTKTKDEKQGVVALPALSGDGRSSLRRGGRIEGGLSVEHLGEPAPLAIDTIEASERDYGLVSPPCFPLSLFSPLPVFPSPCFPLSLFSPLPVFPSDCFRPVDQHFSGVFCDIHS